MRIWAWVALSALLAGVAGGTGYSLGHVRAEEAGWEAGEERDRVRARAPDYIWVELDGERVPARCRDLDGIRISPRKWPEFR
jgi:hypothetical protein